MKDAINGVHGWLTDLIAFVTNIANGDLSASMAKRPPRRIRFTNGLYCCRRALQPWRRTQLLLPPPQHAGQVRYTCRCQPSSWSEFRKIIEGVNWQTLDSIVAPLKITGENASTLASASEELTAVSQSMADKRRRHSETG